MRLRIPTVTHKAAAEHPFKIRHLTKMFLFLLTSVLQSSQQLLATVPSSLYPFIQRTDKMTVKRHSKVQIYHTATLSVGQEFLNVFGAVQ